jgi:hypothetical protein
VVRAVCCVQKDRWPRDCPPAQAIQAGPLRRGEYCQSPERASGSVTWSMVVGGASGELMRMAVGRTDAPAIQYHRRRCMLMSARCADLFISIAATISASNCRELAPLAQSVERIHGKDEVAGSSAP